MKTTRVEMKNPPGYYPPGKTRAGQHSKSAQYWAILFLTQIWEKTNDELYLSFIILFFQAAKYVQGFILSI